MGFFSKLFKRTKHRTYYLEDELTDAQMIDNRDRIESLLRATERRGMDRVIKFMYSNKFFILPSSFHHHHNWTGGLAQHSLSVYDRARAAYPEIDGDSLILVCLLHDLCKAETMLVDKYGGFKRRHSTGPGRGRKSLKILNKCRLELTEEERRAIRWHMGGNNAKDEEFEDAETAKTELLWKAVYEANREDSMR